MAKLLRTLGCVAVLGLALGIMGGCQQSPPAGEAPAPEEPPTPEYVEGEKEMEKQ